MASWTESSGKHTESISIHTFSSHAYIAESFSHESTRAFTRLTAWKFARPAVEYHTVASMSWLIIQYITRDTRTETRAHTAPKPSFHPMGINAAATSETPRSVASKLNWAAAFLVSSTSTLMPSSAMCCLVCGLKGMLLLPTPMTSKS